MALGSCLTSVKYILFVFNSIFWLFGCLLLAIGIWIVVDPGAVRDVARDHELLSSVVIYGMITIGSIMTIIGFIGCCGSIRESRCLLTLFFIMLFIIHGILISVGLYMMIERNKTREWFPEPTRDKVTSRLKKYINESERDDGARKFMEEIEAKHKCCGADQGRADYSRVTYEPTCKKPNRPCLEPEFRAEYNRNKWMVERLPKYLTITSAILIGISVLMIVGMILSIVLCCALKNELI